MWASTVSDAELLTDLAHLAGHLEQAADPAAAREAILLRKAIQAITGLTDELLPYRVFHSDAKSYDKIPALGTWTAMNGKPLPAAYQAKLNAHYAKLQEEAAKPIAEPNAQIEGAPV